MVNKNLFTLYQNELAILSQQGYGAEMSDEQPSHQSQNADNRSAGGFFIAIGTVLGAIVGAVMGQPSIGFLTGLGLGSSIALLIWLRER